MTALSVFVSKLGARGPAGAQILEGAAAPGEEQGNEGDFYLRSGPGDETNLYGPKTEGAWGAPRRLTGNTGAPGLKGWSAKFGLVIHGDRIVRQLVAWIGGQGVAPDGVGLYEGSEGLVEDIADAIDVRGAPGMLTNLQGEKDDDEEVVEAGVVPDEERVAQIAEIVAEDVAQALIDATPKGVVVDRGYAEYASDALLTTAIPFDDTIPQVTEGVQILTVTLTPKKIGNRFRIRCQGFGSRGNGTLGHGTLALFMNGSANAIAASGSYMEDSGAFVRPIQLEKELAVASLVPHTFTIRAGGEVANAMRLNGVAGRRYGGVAATTLVVEEIATP